MDAALTGGAATASAGGTVDDAVRAHAAARPDAPAVVGPAATLTWAQLDAAAARAAGILAATHPEPGARVAWLGPNDVGYPIAVLAAWRRRGALVGLNHRLPDEALAESCRETGVTHVFAPAAWAARARAVAPAGAHVEIVDQASAEPWPDAPAAAPLTPAADDMALVFFTSGSTGTPKAVPLDRRAVETGAATPTAHRFDTGSRLLIVPPVFHLAGAYWAQYGLLHGAPQIYPGDAAPGAIVAAMARHRITHAVFVPTLIRAILDHLAAHPVPLPHLRHLAYGASPITVPLLREAIGVLGCELCQVYGMTEAGGVVTYLPPSDHRLDGPHAGRLASAGRPTEGVRVQVRDLATGEELPAGRSGALWFSTPFMARGYLGRPDDTRAVFADGWLDSRDVGHVDGDGYVYVEGRSDDMIITGGENVHPGEVEGAIAALPGITEVAVVGLPDERWGRRVCAAVVAADPAVDEQAVIGHCRTVLAGYKVPRSVAFLAELPKTATGKITRSRVRAELTARAEAP